MLKSLAMASVGLLLMATATAQERPPSADGAARSVSVESERGGGSGLAGDNVVANNWNWYKPQRTWSYFNGATQRLWMDMQNSTDVIELNANGNDQAIMLDLAAASNHWLGIYWNSGTTWTASQLWYY